MNFLQKFVTNFVLLIICNNCFCYAQQQSFKEHPVNTSVLLGQEATLKCLVSNQQGEALWCKGDSFCTFGRNRKFSDARISIVGDATKGEHNLVIKNATISDNIQYHCQVTASEKSKALKSDMAFLTVLMPPRVVRMTPNILKDITTVKIVLKINSTIECIAEDSNPQVTFNWYIDGEKIEKNNEALDISTKFERTANKLYKTTGKLIIRAESDARWNNKNIKCEAVNEATDLLKTNLNNTDTKLLMAFYAATGNLKPVANVDLISGEHSQFECDVSARPTITSYKWSIDSTIYADGPNERFLTLKIDKSMFKKSLKCNVTNDAGMQSFSYLLDITYPPKFKNLLPSHKLVALNERLDLICEVDSNPISFILWKLNGSLIYSFPNYTISSMKSDNYGIYTCEASLKDFSSITSSVKVIPPGPPMIEAQNIQFGYPHHSARLECFTENEPKAEVIHWYKDNERISTRPYSKYESYSSEPSHMTTKHMLSILDLTEKDFTNYTCVAINKYGESRQLIELMPKSNSEANFALFTSIIGFSLLLIIILGCCTFLKSNTNILMKFKRNKHVNNVERWLSSRPSILLHPRPLIRHPYSFQYIPNQYSNLSDNTDVQYNLAASPFYQSNDYYTMSTTLSNLNLNDSIGQQENENSALSESFYQFHNQRFQTDV